MAVYDKIKISRSAGRATASDFIGAMVTDFVEMRGDRRYADDRAVIAGIGLLKGMPVTVIGIEKGHDTADKIERNFGSAHPEGYRKALRQMKLAEKFRRPVLCLVDTSGAYCGTESEERGQGQAIAENLAEMMTLKVPIVSVLIGEGGSGGALGLAVADEVWMLENAYYSVVSPEGCASILWKDAARAADAAECLKLTADDLLSFGVIEKKYSERGKLPILASRLREDLYRAFSKYGAMDSAELLAKRYEKFRKIGRTV